MSVFPADLVGEVAEAVFGDGDDAGANCVVREVEGFVARKVDEVDGVLIVGDGETESAEIIVESFERLDVSLVEAKFFGGKMFSDGFYVLFEGLGIVGGEDFGGHKIDATAGRVDAVGFAGFFIEEAIGVVVAGEFDLFAFVGVVAIAGVGVF